MADAQAPRYIQDYIATRAREAPDDLCWVFGDRRWTWSEAWIQAQAAAGALRAAGVRRADTVAFVDKNHPAAALLTLASGILGSSVSVINWRLSRDELAYTLNDCGARIVFVGAEFSADIHSIREQLPAATRIIVVGGEADELTDWLHTGVPLENDPAVEVDDTCVVLYSSGTTGRPKGIRLTHRNYVGYMASNIGQIRANRGGMMIVASPMFHVGGTSTALVNQALGLSSYFIREVSLEALEAGLDAGATHMFLVPSVVAQIIQAGVERMARFAQLEVFIYGAMPMPKPVLDAAIAAWPNTEFMHAFGMTELAGVTTYLSDADHRDATHPERLVSVGRPIPGVAAKIVDIATQDENPHGAAGEIWFRSEQATPGYLNQPAATAELITADGWVRTGDVGRMDKDGYIFVEDRIKDMIISGGENVYSPEVERVLAAFPGVLEAVIIGVPDDRWGETVKAIVVPAPGAELDPAKLIDHCRDRLAHFKAPSSVDVVDELPRNPSGKILKRNLRSPYWNTAGRQV